ncbi:carbohydrate deacetylase isoform X1 [Biomphalaria glabrata]|nr:carbohydrate deacetylase isoform X1 [Biomphalaria glabrata]
MKRYLIITGDDFGFSWERNEGVMEAFNKGAITSASLLLNCTGTEEGAAMFKSSQLCPGLHLNLTEGSPVGEFDYETLVSTEEVFRGKFALRKHLDLGLHLNLTEGVPIANHQYKTLTNETFNFHGMLPTPRLLDAGNIDEEEIKRELDSQIKKFIELVGRAPVYVDGHQHIHLHPKVVELFAAALKQHNIHITRFPVEINMAAKEWVNPEYMPFFLAMIEKAHVAKKVLDDYGIKTTDSFVGLSTMGRDMTPERLQKIILEAFEDAESRLSSDKRGFTTCELMTHPGYPTHRILGGFSWGSDDFGCSEDRIHEINVLSSPEMKDFYKQNNIELVSHSILLS